MRNDEKSTTVDPGLREFMKIARRNRPTLHKTLRDMVERPRAARTPAQLKAYLRIERGGRA